MRVHTERKSISLGKFLATPITDANRAETIGQAVAEFCEVARHEGIDPSYSSNFFITIESDNITCDVAKDIPDQESLQEYVKRAKEASRVLYPQY